jgi:hypothetical protein
MQHFYELLQGPESLTLSSLLRHKAMMGSDFRLQFCPECSAPFQTPEELLKNAHDNCIHANPLFLGPMLKGSSSFSPDVKKLRVREW